MDLKDKKILLSEVHVFFRCYFSQLLSFKKQNRKEEKGVIRVSSNYKVIYIETFQIIFQKSPLCNIVEK